MTLARIHRLAGLFALVLFISTGIFMRVKFPEIDQGKETVRLLFRSGHIYLLFSAAMNLALSLGGALSSSPVRRRLQVFASALVLAAPAVLFGAFFVDPPDPESARILSRVGVIAAVAGALIHSLAAKRV